LLLLALVHAEAGEFEQALSCVARYRRDTGAMEGSLGEYQALLVEAYVALRRSDRPGCHSSLRRALAIAIKERYQSHWGWSPLMMVRLYSEALNHGIETAYVRGAIKLHRLLPESPEIEHWPWPINIYTLGRFEVMTDGEVLHVEGKAQRKPIELIKVLVALGGSDVPANKLIDVLWPTPSDGDGQKALDITVHRVRKLLGSDDAVKVTDRRASLNPQMVWIDVWALERKLAPLIPAVNAARPDIALLEAAAPQVLTLYRGHFLTGETEEPWQIPLRNRLAGRFQRFVLRLGEHWEANQAWARAGELYQRAIELDPLAEIFYRRHMICLRAQGQRAEAMEVFRRCRQTLSVVLGVTPSTETEAVFRQLHDA
jgi:DNA-binding SARP family transcriptional activator